MLKILKSHFYPKLRPQGFLALWFLFQLVTLNVPELSSDEALGVVMFDELRKLSLGQFPSLNPVLEYLGPADTWLITAPYLLWPFWPFAALLRFVPLFFCTAGFAVLLGEIQRIEKKPMLSWLGVVFLTMSPLALVYSRVAFPHGILIGLMALLLAEVARTFRAGSLRPWVFGGIAGLALEMHPTGAIGAAAIAWPVARAMFKGRVRLPRAGAWLLAVGLFALFSYPVLRNFPPPVGTPREAGRHVFSEFVQSLGLWAGYFPYGYFFGDQSPLHKMFPEIAILIASIFIVVGSTRAIWKARPSWIKDVAFAHAVASVLLFYFCLKGRSLAFAGHERYFVALIPGVALCLAWGWAQGWNERRLRITRVFAVVSFGVFAVQLLPGLVRADQQSHAARWLMSACPRESCVVYAEGFWNYWTLRYYSRDRLDINCIGANWKTQPQHERRGRRAVACWHDNAASLQDITRTVGAPQGTVERFAQQLVREPQACASVTGR